MIQRAPRFSAEQCARARTHTQKGSIHMVEGRCFVWIEAEPVILLSILSRRT